MEPRHRTHLVNELMDETQLMMSALEKAMEGARIAQTFPGKPGAPHPQEPYSLEDEHKAWGNVLQALTEIQKELDHIDKYEHRRSARVSPQT